MQSLNVSITRGKPFVPKREMPKGGGLPLCLSGVCIMTQVPQKKTTLHYTSSRCRNSSRDFTATRNYAVCSAFDLNAAEPLNRACEADERTGGYCSLMHSSHYGNGGNVHPARSAVAQKMAELDRQRESLRERRSIQGLGSFLEEQAFLMARQARRPQELIRSRWLELAYVEVDSSNPWLGNSGARAA